MCVCVIACACICVCIFMYVDVCIFMCVYEYPRSRHNKDFKMVLDVSLLNTQQYKVSIKGKGAIQGKE